MSEDKHVNPPHGTICWTELGTKDIATAKKFYTELFGWKINDSQGASGMDYSEIEIGGRQVGGMYQLTEKMSNIPSHWISYIAVDDVEKTAEQVTELGGKIMMPPMDIPHVGRFCVISDPTGASIALITLRGDA
jgi:predicted enzyme related to lactoylglutathione lyase